VRDFCFLSAISCLELVGGYYIYPFIREKQCPVSKAGTDYGEATLFQEDWVHGKTGACGFERPFSDHAEGFFTAVGTADWEEGYACGTCAELEYRGNVITVNVVDRCGACTKGWFDLGGPAWTALTNGQPPGHIHGVKSRWIACPASLTGGNNLHLYVKPGSHAWDARFQPVAHILPVRSLHVDGGSGWQKMSKCENYMFCKPRGVTLHGEHRIRVISDSGNIDITVPNIPEGKYIDTGTNNGGTCTAPGVGSKPVTITTPRPRPTLPTMPPTTTPFSSSSYVDCSVKDGLFPDPQNCRGFIKCAQGDSYPMECGGGLYFDIVTYNCNWAWNTDCNGRPAW